MSFAISLTRIIGAALIVAAPVTLAAQAADGSPPASSQPATPGPAPDTPSKPDEPLSKKLHENDGVLKPAPGIDNEMHKAPPEQSGDKMPVIIPPGEPGGDQSIQPK